jgi:hypothetical protein
MPNRPETTIQHVVEGNKRLGHRFTYGCCGWHHLGENLPGKTRHESMMLMGPSLALSKTEYRARFGAERHLVALQDLVLELFEKNPWKQYHMRYDVLREIATEWQRLQGLR